MELKSNEPDFTKYSLALFSNEGELIFQLNKPGLRPIIECVNEFSGKYKDCILHDKVFGLAATHALASSSGLVKTLYSTAVSKSAHELLTKIGVEVKMAEVVPNIMNEDRTQVCGMEKKAEAEPEKTSEQFYKETLEILRIKPK